MMRANLSDNILFLVILCLCVNLNSCAFAERNGKIPAGTVFSEDTNAYDDCIHDCDKARVPNGTRQEIEIEVKPIKIAPAIKQPMIEGLDRY